MKLQIILKNDMENFEIVSLYIRIFSEYSKQVL